eukprot:CAMPEP_0170520662 /NCGR_PEP_ID=MMETSP0209-20121228/5999_1 /TAXON_ID=665100 ORGANISM="Litonotus pictus, Strain P1" /NCGR_SAMPLE_ID=MMETSP0209 /ASSEMBLY_ACC=CAM_ASM_000301 /LENGTH=370 /DNA_ID=CAMNT_0010807129 /DNA_START=240 /DNA_END=1352 /DNA_ORIENTATION=+
MKHFFNTINTDDKGTHSSTNPSNTNNPNNKTESKTVSLGNIISSLIKNSSSEIVLEIALILLGSLNSMNSDFYSTFKLIKPSINKKFHFIDHYQQSMNYESFIKDNLEILFSEFMYRDFLELTKTLNAAGVVTDSKQSENFMLLARNRVFDNDKILIVICGNNFSWYKCPQKSIDYYPYDTSLNKHNFIYWNKSFIEQALFRFSNHPRIEFGFMSSMLEKNLSKVIDSMKISFISSISNEKKNIWLLHQDDHNKDQSEGKPKDRDQFFRSMDKILKKTRFSETKTVILEAEDLKMNENSNTKENSIMLPYYVDEKFFCKSPEEQQRFKEVNKVLVDRIVKEIVDTCDDDVRINIYDFNNKTKQSGYMEEN